MKYLYILFLINVSLSATCQMPFYEMPEGSGSCDENIAFIFWGQSNNTAAESYVADLTELERRVRGRGFINTLASLENYDPNRNANPNLSGEKFGPEIYFIDRLMPFFQTVNICKFTRGGTGVRERDDRIDFSPNSVGEAYDDMVVTINNFIGYMDVKYGAGNWKWGGIVSTIGESDRAPTDAAMAYNSTLGAVMNGIKSLVIPSAPIFQNRLWEGVTQLGVEVGQEGADELRISEQQYCDSINVSQVNCNVVPTTDITILADPVHINSASTILRSKRLAKYYLNFLAGL